MMALTARRRQIKKVLGNLQVLAYPALRSRGTASIESVGSVPYGVAIAAGTMAVLLATAA
jgi:prepilin peptidase CpaA